uniref:SET domain-containing protein n=1 Tax=Triticum urartu TaxID=4572 RepID=A0A8R7UXP0_TRIUA
MSSTAAAAPSDGDAKLQCFLQWLQANGADLRGCTIRACGRKGFGVYATAADAGAADGVVMAVPLDLAVTPMRVLQDPLVGARCRALFEEGGVDDRLLVMLFLMAERLRPSSLWKPYLDVLPSTFGSSVWFSDEELAEVEGTTLHRATVMQRESLQKLFDDKVKGLVEELLHVDESGSSIEVRFEDFLWANSIFWTRALNIPLPHSYVFPGSLDEQQNRTGEALGASSLTNQQETDITTKNCSGEEIPESCNTESIWVEGLVPGIDFCNHNVKALATWEVDSVGNLTGIPASMYLMLVQAGKSSVETGTEIYINYGNKGNEELLYLYGFVVDNNPDDYLMVHYPVEALRQLQSADVKMKLIEMQKAELRCLLPTSLLDRGFFGTSTSSSEDDNKKNASHFSSYSWSGQRKVPSYLHKNLFPQEFLSTLRTIAMQEHELEQVASLLGEVGSSEDGEPSDAEIKSAIWEVCGDHGALGLLVDLLRVKMAELEEGTGTEASDSQLLEKFDSIDAEDSSSATVQNYEATKTRVNRRSCIVYRRGQKQLTRMFLWEAERLWSCPRTSRPRETLLTCTCVGSDTFCNLVLLIY